MAKNTQRDKWLKYKTALVVVISLCFGYVLWYAYYIHVDNVREEKLPFVRAPLNIVSKPQDPGGIVVPDKDKGIYNYMSGKKVKRDRIKTARLNSHNFSKSKALALINNQLKKRKIKKKSHSIISIVNKQISSKFFKKQYYLRVAKLTNMNVTNKALQILQNKYPDLKNLKGKVYEEKNKSGEIKYYLHAGPIKEKRSAEYLCAKLISSGKRCKVFLDK